ncbi:MAG: ion transporter [Pseudomonadota bacterium]
MLIRSRVYHDLEPRARPEGLSRANILIAILIVLAAVVAILETEPTLREPYAATFFTLQASFGLVFLIEYLLRIWIAAEDPRFAGKPFGRLRWMMTPSAIIDLLALLPLFLTLASTSLYWLRFARILRILRIVRLGRMSRAFDNVMVALYERRFELCVAVLIALLLMLFSATLLYFAEAEAQPEAFGSVPRALWWAVVTLTTIGYGDVYPVTLLGRACAAMIAITGIGVIAMPTGIFAAAFSDAMQRKDGEDA